MKNILLLAAIALFSITNQAQTVSTFAGTGTAGGTDGAATVAEFSQPFTLTFDSSGNLYVAENSGNKLRKITSAGVVSTLAGTGAAGSTDGVGTVATFDRIRGVVVSAVGDIYVSDNQNHKIRKITTAGVVSTFAGTGVAGSANGAATVATFYYPEGLVIDASGNLYVADKGNGKIRKITSAGVVSNFAGSGAYSSLDGAANVASFSNPSGLAIDGSGNIYVAEHGGNKIRKITSAGLVSTLAGTGTAGSSDGPGSAATFDSPNGVAVDASGNVFVADFSSYVIRKITSAGVVSTIAGTAYVGGSTEGAGTVATFFLPAGVTVDASGDTLYIADFNNQKIRKITGVALSTNSFESTTSAVAYPNPSHDIFTINAEQNTTIAIYDIIGKQILSQKNGSGQIDINLSHCASGIYLARITNENSDNKIIKLIKQ